MRLPLLSRTVDGAGLLAGLLIIPALALIIFEVTARFVFSRPTEWSAEVVQYLFGAIFLLGGAYTLRSGGHVSVDILTSTLDRNGRIYRVLFAFANLLILGFSALLAWLSGGALIDAVRYGERLDSTWAPYLWPIMALALAGSLLLALEGLRRLLNGPGVAEES
ncbi:TRAP transporter small permease subunit [Variovorax sp. LT1P1]|uniref:TRAP transporter small permease subunit n=1 Tax=Variovorax sp. LT1P1 TaxID=3443730 RepID=UPI003F462C58